MLGKFSTSRLASLVCSRALSGRINNGFRTLNDTCGLTEDQIAIQTLALDYTHENIVPYAREWDKTHTSPIEVLKGLG